RHTRFSRDWSSDVCSSDLLDGQDGLEAPVAALLGGAACRVALDDVDLALRRVAFLAVGQLAGQRAAVERALAAHQVACLARRLEPGSASSGQERGEGRGLA